MYQYSNCRAEIFLSPRVRQILWGEAVCQTADSNLFFGFHLAKWVNINLFLLQLKSALITESF